VCVTDDAKLKSTCTTRASPALAHGADEGYSVLKKQSDIDVTAEKENDSLAAAAAAVLQSKTAATTVTDDRSSVGNIYHSVQSLKQKNDGYSKYGTGSADLQRTSSLQDLTEGGLRGKERSMENMVSCGQVDSNTASDVHDVRSSLSSNACFAEPACTGYDRSSTTLAGEHQSRSRTQRSLTEAELESIDNTGIVSNTTRFWEDMVLGWSGSAARCSMRSRHASEDRHRFMRRDASSPRYLTIGATCDVQALHGMICVPILTSDASLQSDSLHANDFDIKVCCWLFCHCFIFAACCCACVDHNMNI